MKLKSMSTAVVLAAALALPVSSPTAAAPITPLVTAAATASGVPLAVSAAKKPRAVVTATYTTLSTGRVQVTITSNAKKVQLKYRTAKNAKRALNRKLKRGTVTVTLPVGAKTITVRAKATSKLATSPWTPATPPAPPAVAPAPQPPAPQPPAPQPPAPDTAPPGPVTGLAVSATTSTSISLSWTNPADADLAAVIVRRDAVEVYTGTGTGFTDTGLAPNSAHSYAVATRDATGNAGPSVTISGTTSSPSQPPGAITRITTDPSGRQLRFGGAYPSWSPDGTKVGLWWQEFDGNYYAFVKDLTTGAIVPLTTDAYGSRLSGNNGTRDTNLDWSTDSTKVAYSTSSPPVAGDIYGCTDAYIKTVSTGEVQQVGTASDGCRGGVQSVRWSPDGTRIAFYSAADNLVVGDTNGFEDVFVKDLASGLVTRANTSATGDQAIVTDDSYGFIEWSPDGTRLAFTSSAGNLVTGDTNNSGDLFVKDLLTGSIQRISTTATGEQADGWTAGHMDWSPDGTRLAFSSSATNLVPGDTNAEADVFVKSLLDGSIERISTTATGEQATGEQGGLRFYDRIEWSPDGTRLAFSSSATNLVPGDTNAQDDVFVKSVSDGTIQRISTSTAGSQANMHSFSPTWSPDGSSIAFTSLASNLVPEDTNDSWDVFVKKLG